MSTIRFLHAADLHLDSPFKGMTGMQANQLVSLRNSTFAAFERLIEHALHLKPDFVLIVGDIYDGENRSLQAQLKFQEGMKKLSDARIPVVISYGNHDHLGGRWTRFELPENVHVLTENVEQIMLNIRGEQVNVYGFSYKERHVRESMITNYPVAENGPAFHIGMLHGSLAGDETHAVYAPFTKAELLQKHYDYWALGHIHLRQQLHMDPPIVYPGNLQGRHRNERGLKGFYEVNLSKTETALNFIPTSEIIFERIDISCAGIRHANEWIEICKGSIDNFKEKHGSGIIELTMTDVDYETAAMFDQTPVEEWLDVLRDVVEERESFVWVQSLSFEKKLAATAVGALEQSVFSMINEWNEDEWKEILNDVYQHTRGVKYLPVLSEDDIQEVKEKAMTIMKANEVTL
ncbi:DNA repair exonuclease [Sporosarcina sp. Marseille-Q4063]|uniref:metallophosphoesterase family protein n=1 Tax=Sporosarcina sp. Marseille-Q4063 TaxID=2810514 RepID=UPI001BAEEABC|nr:DNA repair exonuclease [Sporosarcina sp. Marseille-Q4063]QUW23448.1 DNA repair exonuclease [Sporosarcina sp. Marseille-Q4063]